MKEGTRKWNDLTPNVGCVEKERPEKDGFVAGCRIGFKEATEADLPLRVL